MANKIKESDLFEGDIFLNQRESVGVLLQNIKDLQALSKKKISTINPESAEDIQKLSDELKRNTLERKLGEEARKKDLAIQKQQAQENKKELDAYQQKSKRLNELRKTYKALATEQGLASKEVKKLAKEVQALDKELKDIDASAGQFQRNVGNYPKLADKAKTSFNSLAAVIGTALLGAFASSRAEARTFQGTIEKATNVINVFAQAVIVAFTEIIFPTFEKWGLQLQATKEFLTGNFEESERLSEQAKKLGEAIDKVKNPFIGITEVIDESNGVLEKRLQLQDRLIDDSVRIEANIARLTGQEEALGVAIGDNTTSFEDQRKAVTDLLNIQEQRVNAEVDLAKKQQEIAFLLVEQQLTTKQAFKDLSDTEKEALRERIRSLEFTKDKILADKTTAEALEALKNATVGVITAESQQTTQRKQAAKERRIIQQDEFEQQLDILLDGFDNQKTINERIIADELKTFDERRKVLDRTKQLNEQNFKDQENLFIEQTGLQIDLNDLVNTDDQRLLAQKLKNLEGLSEIERQRLLEVIRDQRTANKDLLDAETELNQSIIESKQRTADSLREIDRLTTEFQIGQNERRFEKEEQRQEQNIVFKTAKLKEFVKLNEGLQFEILEAQNKADIAEANRIVDATERNAKLLEIDKKFQLDVFALNQDTFDKIAELDEKARIKRVENFEKTTSQINDIINEQLDKQTERQQEALDKQAENRERSLEQQRERALQGLKSTVGEETLLLAKEQLKREQLERQAEKKRALLQDLEAFRQAYIANLKQPNANSTDALLKAGADIGKFKVLQTVIGGLFSFKDGTENTGKVKNPLDKDGGRLTVLHDDERVLSKVDNAPLLKMGVKNADLPDLVALGVQAKSSFPNMMQSVRLNQTNKELVSEIRELKDIVKNKTEYRDFTDKHGNHVSSMIEKGMKRTITYTRSKPRI
jgi:hypothetical protein